MAKGTFYNYFPDKDALDANLPRTFAGGWKMRSRASNEGIHDPAKRIARAFCCVLRLGLSAASSRQAR